jgi:saccharopine dehydrogenase-like NADP-dependent oxidoreductase
VTADTYRIIIAGAGGIGRAAGLLLCELGGFNSHIYLGDRYEAVAKEAVKWIQTDSSAAGDVDYFVMPKEGSDENFDALLDHSDIILDCLPGNQAPRIAGLARQHGLHYVNLTEYVKETAEVIEIACEAEKGYILQAGLAPGFINVLANGLYHQFCRDYNVEKVDAVHMKVGALTQTAYPP